MTLAEVIGPDAMGALYRVEDLAVGAEAEAVGRLQLGCDRHPAAAIDPEQRPRRPALDRIATGAGGAVDHAAPDAAVLVRLDVVDVTDDMIGIDQVEPSGAATGGMDAGQPFKIRTDYRA